MKETIEKLRGFKATEIVGISNPNQKGSFILTGTPEFLEAFLKWAEQQGMEVSDATDIDGGRR